MSKVVIKKKDNSFLQDKINIRFQECLRLNTNSLRVLDCFHGMGKIWAGVKELFPGEIEVVGIEKERGKSPFTVLEGENRKFLPRLDLSSFDLIDLDAYGTMSGQFHDIVNNPTFQGQNIFFTEITTYQAAIAREILKANNALHIYKKNRTVLRSLYYTFLFEMFRKSGAKRVKYFRRDKNASRKMYGVIYF